MTEKSKNTTLGALSLVIVALLAFIIIRPSGEGEVAGQAVGSRSVANDADQQSQKQSEQQQVQAYEEAHAADFAAICDDVEALMEGETPDGTQLSTAASPCSVGDILDGDKDAIRECCEALGHMGCHVYCKIQDDHSYNTCMNGILWFDGCLDKVEDMCDDLIDNLSVVKD